jgi:hypothetical protein
MVRFENNMTVWQSDNLLKSPPFVNRKGEFALPQFFPLFAKGLGKPLSKASSGQA